MKKKLSIALLFVFIGIPMMAQENTGIFIDMVLQSGETESLILRNDASYVGARFIGSQKLFKINGKVFDMSEVKEFKFVRRDVTDGIERPTLSSSQKEGKGIYDLQGRKVRDLSAPLGTHREGVEGLKPGIYIVNGKKVVIK